LSNVTGSGQRAERGGEPPAPDVEQQRLEVIRLSFRSARHLRQDVAGERGAGLAGERLFDHHDVAKDTSHRTVLPVFTAGGGFA
jgi:glutamine synthetase